MLLHLLAHNEISQMISLFKGLQIMLEMSAVIDCDANEVNFDGVQPIDNLFKNLNTSEGQSCHKS